MIGAIKQQWNRITKLLLTVCLVQGIIEYANLDMKEMDDYADLAMGILNDSAEHDSTVRRNETICCLIGFGIGVGCCILYRLLSNFLAPSSSSSSSSSATSISANTLSSLSNNKRDVKAAHMGQEHSSFSSNGNEITVTYTKRPRSSTALKPNLPDTFNATNNRSLPQAYSQDSDREPLLGLPIDKHHEYVSNKTFTTSHLSDEMTWSEISSSLGTAGLLQDSYHSNSLTGDSGVDCQDISTIRSSRNQARPDDLTTTTTTTTAANPIPVIDDDHDEDDDDSMINYSTNGTNTLLFPGPRRYDSDTALSRGVLLQDTQTATESHVMSYMSTENGLDRALEQTSRFYSDLEHIATDLNTLSQRYSQSQMSISPSLSKYYQQHNRPVFNTIDALDWDWNDVYSPPLIQSPKASHRKQPFSSSLPRLNNHANKSKVRRKLTQTTNQTEYHESDLELRSTRSFDCTSSPLKRRPSSVYFDSTDNTSGDETFGDETLQLPSSPTVLTSSRTTEFNATIQ